MSFILSAGRPQWAAIVVAAILKEWAAYSLAGSPHASIALCITRMNCCLARRVPSSCTRKGPEPGGLRSIIFFVSFTGQGPLLKVAGSRTKAPFPFWSVFERRMRTTNSVSESWISSSCKPHDNGPGLPSWTTLLTLRAPNMQWNRRLKINGTHN